MAPRREFSAATKRAAWERAKGQCEGIQDEYGQPTQLGIVTGVPARIVFRCNAPLDHGNFYYDHIDPDWYSKDNELENCQVLCVHCHAAKTRKDVKAIAKSKRIIDKRIKARKLKGRPLPGTKASGIRKRFDGTVEKW